MQKITEYFKSLPRKILAAEVLFTNNQGQIFLVKPTYKKSWGLPGGVVEKHESPKNAAIREIKEEIGITVGYLPLLVVDYSIPSGPKDDGVMFMFFGGILDEDKIKKIKLAENELSKFVFVSLVKAKTMLAETRFRASLADRLEKALDALKLDKIYYLEDGEFIK